MANRITAKTAKEWKALAGIVPVYEIARRYGVHNQTVYYHINAKTAARRRETWRAAQRKKKAGAGAV